MNQPNLWLLLIIVTVAVLASRPAANSSSSSRAEGPEATTVPVGTTSVAEAYGKLPLRFEPNAGQTDNEVRFTARAARSRSTGRAT